MRRSVQGSVAVLASLWALASSDARADAKPDLSQGQANNNPRVFAIALAQNEVPAGIVIPAEFLRGGKGMPHPEITTARQAAFRVDLLARVDLFNADKGAFRASRGESGVVHIRSVEEPIEVTRALEHESEIELASGPAIGVVFRTGVTAIRGYAPEGLLGSGGPSTPEPECPLDRRVELPKGRMTAMGVLDAIVRQVPGMAWVVTYRRVPASPSLEMKLGLLCSNGRYLTISVFP